MTEAGNIKDKRQERIYNRTDSVVFLKTKELFGGLSNMAGGYPLCVNGVQIRTSEALYQACRFPHLPDVQRLIIEQKSPMAAKMKSKPHRHNSRPDWDKARVNIMRWCLRVKLVQNWDTFSKLLLETGDRSIVEESRKDSFWGAKPVDYKTLKGFNILGRLLMELREAVKSANRESLLCVEPLSLPDFSLDGKPIGVIHIESGDQSVQVQASEGPNASMQKENGVSQPSLFDQPTVQETPPSSTDRAIKKADRLHNLKPYPAMKDSGVEWIGQVPKHWESRPAFTVFDPKQERNHGMKEKTVLSLSYGRIIIKPPEKLHGLVPESFETYQVVNPGDIVLRTTDLQNDHTSLRVGKVRDRGIITSAYLSLRVKPDVMPDFGFQFLNVWDISKAIYGYGSGLRQNLAFSHFKRMAVPLPPMSEQTAIVRYLDHVDRRVRRLVRRKRKLITLLNEQKQAIIHQAVTRGLDPDVPLKDSGVEWLGKVPEHWDVLRTKYIFKEVDKRSTTGEETHLSMSQKLGLVPSNLVQSSLTSESYIGGKLCEAEDLVLNRLKAHLGVFALAKQSGVISPDYSVFRKKISVNMKYFEHILRSQACRRELRIRAKGIVEGFWRLYTDDFYDIRVPVPPVTEQNLIIAELDQNIDNIDTAIVRAKREIELLNEYRTRLTVYVVTGKLDVREAADALPEIDPLGADEPENTLDADVDMEEIDVTPEEVEA